MNCCYLALSFSPASVESLGPQLARAKAMKRFRKDRDSSPLLSGVCKKRVKSKH